MEFGYFTLSDTHYPNNARSANQFVLEIREQAIFADRIGMHSAWIGEDALGLLRVKSRPGLLLDDIIDKAIDAYREACVSAGSKRGRAMCSYFIFIADDAKSEDYGRQSQLDYFNHCVIRAIPNKPEEAPPTMQYFMKITEILRNMKKETLTDRSILLGRLDQIIESLKKVEKAGIEEVILYFNVGNKPHNMVKEQMHRYMQEIAPHFQGKHLQRMKQAA